MAGVDKIINKMKNQPHSIRLAEAEKVLMTFGYHLARQKGSHKHYINEAGDVITLKEPLKIAYIKEILKRINED